MYRSSTIGFRVLGLFLLFPAITCMGAFADSTSKKKRRVSVTGIALPARSPENGFYVQGGIIGLFNTDPKDSTNRGSNIYLFGMYSQLRQWKISNGGDVFTKKEKYYLNYWYYLSYLPDKYFGIGKEVNPDSSEFIDYTVISFQTNIFRKLKPKLFAGLSQHFESVSKLSKPDSGIMDLNPVTGNRAYLSSGAGVKLKFDNRDNLFSTRKGWLAESGFLLYGSAIGSDFSFNEFYLDVRKFNSFQRKVWANQLYFASATGQVPFRKLPSVVARGYHPNLFRGNQMASWQTELRATIWKRLAFSAFGGLSYSGNPEISRFLYNLGGGFRFNVIPAYNMYMRIEYGVGEGSSSVYLSFYDAF